VLKVSFLIKLFSLLTSVVLFLGSAQSATAEENLDLARPGVGDPTISNFRETPALWSSFLWPQKNGLVCWNSTDKKCKFDSSVSGHGFIVAPLCSKVSQDFCIESLYAISEDGRKFLANPTEAINEDDNPIFTVKSKRGSLTSGVPSLWRFDQGFPDTRDYLLNAFTMVNWNKGAKYVDLVGLELALTPISSFREGGQIIEQNLPLGFRFGVQLRLDWQIGGFLMGRLSQINLSQETIKKGFSRSVIIEALPEAVAKISGSNANGKIAYSMEDYPDFKFQADKSGDRATHIDRVFRAFSRKTIDFSCAGFDSGFYGTGTTNASMYAVDPPYMSNGFLNYEVAGIHFLQDGKSINFGKYEMSLRSDVARCIYGLRKTPLTAKINVVNANGNKTIATTVLSEKKGWLKLAAYGFTFSKKKITIKLKNR